MISPRQTANSSGGSRHGCAGPRLQNLSRWRTQQPASHSVSSAFPDVSAPIYFAAIDQRTQLVCPRHFVRTSALTSFCLLGNKTTALLLPRPRPQASQPRAKPAPSAPQHKVAGCCDLPRSTLATHSSCVSCTCFCHVDQCPTIHSSWPVMWGWLGLGRVREAASGCRLSRFQ